METKLTQREIEYLAKFKAMYEEDSKKFPNKVSIMVFKVRGQFNELKSLAYVFRTWEAFEKRFPFSDIDPMNGIDFAIWVDDD
jgi:hypothetical protein